jgi:short subunit fatty acids transporter
MPDPFVLVLALTALTWAASVWMLARHGVPAVSPAQTSSPMALAAAAGASAEMLFKGFSELLTFAMQMVLIVVTGEAIAQLAARREGDPPRWLMIPRTQGAVRCCS